MGVELQLPDGVHEAKGRAARRQGSSESGMGLPHSTTSRKKWHAGIRASVVERGSPMPLFHAVYGVHQPTVHGERGSN
jgi:hypothetical protein